MTLRERCLVLLLVLPLASACATATELGVGGATDGGEPDTSKPSDTGGSDAPPSDGGGDAGEGGACIAPKKTCGTKCTDVATDKDNCGACGNACGGTATCVGSKCVCGKDEVTCSGKCVNLLTDKNNCGSCDFKCGKDPGGTDKICVDAGCKLDCTGKVDCGSEACVDLKTDDKNCGACGKICATGEKCAAGTCIACPTTGTICTDKCVDLKTDAANCGSCGKKCGAGQTCTGGTCTCATGLTDCSGVCKDLMNDGTNCGKCASTCIAPLVCNAGTCATTCGSGKIACGTSCLDASADPLNCGACGKICPSTAPYCSAGTCVAVPTCAKGPYKILFYGGIGTLEQPYVPTGSVVTVATDATWSAMTTADFAKYHLLVIGEGAYDMKAKWDAADATKAAWGPAVTGRVIVHTLDPCAHTGSGATFLRGALAWAAGGGGTGLYVGPDYGARKLDFMSSFGAWTALGQIVEGVAGDDVHITKTTHATMTGLTDASLSSWGYSYHGAITAYPPAFGVVAAVTSAPTHYVAVTRDTVCSP